MTDKEIIELIQEILRLRKENRNLKEIIKRIRNFES